MQLTDHTASTRLITTESGSVIGRHDYLPFGDDHVAGSQQFSQPSSPSSTGNQMAASSSSTTSTGFYNWETTQLQRFAQLESDPATGLRHTDYRKYDDWQGRWTSTDPSHSSMSIGDPQSFNGKLASGLDDLKEI